MADAKITALTENTTPITTDILPMVDDPAGTPATQKVTVANLKTVIMGSAIIAVSVDDYTGIPATTNYVDIVGVPITTETYAGIVMSKAGTIKKLYVDFGANTLNVNCVITLMKNGEAQTLTCTLATGVLTGNDTSNSFTVVAGDRLTFRIAVGAGTGSAKYFRASVEIAF